MDARLDELLSIASEAIGEPIALSEFFEGWGELGRQLVEMLSRKNGFYAFESALLVRPLRGAASPRGVVEWNSPALWKGEYHDDLGSVLFFAEDIFGCQFCIRGDEICTFDPETAKFEAMALSVEGWASEVMSDYSLHTGYPLAHEWQDLHGSLTRGYRLLPVPPFVTGGKYEVENLFATPEVEGMSFRAFLSNGIRDLPDGAKIIFKLSSESDG